MPPTQKSNNGTSGDPGLRLALDLLRGVSRCAYDDTLYQLRNYCVLIYRLLYPVILSERSESKDPDDS